MFRQFTINWACHDRRGEWHRPHGALRSATHRLSVSGRNCVRDFFPTPSDWILRGNKVLRAVWSTCRLLSKDFCDGHYWVIYILSVWCKLQLSLTLFTSVVSSDTQPRRSGWVAPLHISIIESDFAMPQILLNLPWASPFRRSTSGLSSLSRGDLLTPVIFIIGWTFKSSLCYSPPAY